ncbi:porin [Agrobacterium sp. a22-2]|uniref:porin n=1 Tax=Agrobacterium sp. a22-2 TaxID=2283840 RepID=UPI00144657D4|nr:porin [Agrobacterium sp. a22-2]NKN37930.1 porin [Agrobacterium sp. a22-2]
MNIKSLLLGSAAALAAVSGAQAADAIVAVEPEPMEYVRVCDAFGTGYFYIPGTETCLKLSGYVRAQVDMFEDDDGDFAADMWTRAHLEVEAKNDSEIGTIGSFFAFQVKGLEDGTNEDPFTLDEAYITAGGFKVGYMYNYWDSGLAGETDDLGSNLINSAGYQYTSDAFSFGIFVDELNASVLHENDGIGLEAQATGSFGAVTAALLGAYDFAREEGAVRLIVEAEVGPGTLGLAAIYSSGVNQYYDTAEWTIAGSYAAKLSDKFTLTPGAQFFSDYDLVDGNDAWAAGLTVDYKIADGLAAKAYVEYFEEDIADDGVWSGFVRLQRSF